jgi:hypothetical protein
MEFTFMRAQTNSRIEMSERLHVLRINELAVRAAARTAPEILFRFSPPEDVIRSFLRLGGCDDNQLDRSVCPWFELTSNPQGHIAHLDLIRIQYYLGMRPLALADPHNRAILMRTRRCR